MTISARDIEHRGGGGSKNRVSKVLRTQSNLNEAAAAAAIQPDGSIPFTDMQKMIGNILAVEAGLGITAGGSVVYASSVEEVGGLIHTRVLLDMTDLKSSTTDLDIIGVEGADMITNGDWAADSDWDYGADWSFASNKADCAPGAGTIMQPAVPLTIVVGETYELTYTMSTYAAGACVASVGGTNFTSRGSDASFTERVVAADTENLLFTGNAAGDYQIDDVILKHVGPAHLGQITVARNGVLISGQHTWLVTPATGQDDIVFYSADESDAVFDDGIGALTAEVVLYDKTSAAAAAYATQIAFGNLPVADQYLYLTGGAAGTAATYSAGLVLIEFLGYRA